MKLAKTGLHTIAALFWISACTHQNATSTQDGPAARATAGEGLRVIEDYPIQALESEVGGISAHPTDDALYLVATNSHPAYKSGQTPLLPESLRGSVLAVERRTGEVKWSLPLTGGDYGGIAFGDGHLFVSSLEPAELLKVDLDHQKIVARFPLSSPAGGLEYDRAEKVLLAQHYLGTPHLSVLDATTGRLKETLWSDESAMGLSIVQGDLLCTWASGFDDQAFGELRRLDRKTGKVIGRLPLPAVHFATAPLADGFLSMVRTEAATSRVAIRRYQYAPALVRWR